MRIHIVSGRQISKISKPKNRALVVVKGGYEGWPGFGRGWARILALTRQDGTGRFTEAQADAVWAFAEAAIFDGRDLFISGGQSPSVAVALAQPIARVFHLPIQWHLFTTEPRQLILRTMWLANDNLKGPVRKLDTEVGGPP